MTKLKSKVPNYKTAHSLNRRVRVTIWESPQWDQKLVLEGTIMQTIELARSYLADGSDAKTLKGHSDYMMRKEIAALPEHGG